MGIRSEVEQISVLEQQWGWTPPKRVFDTVREAASRRIAAGGGDDD